MSEHCVISGNPKMRFVAIGDDVETDCIECRETLLFNMKDKMSVYVGMNADGTTEVFGVYCARCARSAQ